MADLSPKRGDVRFMQNDIGAEVSADLLLQGRLNVDPGQYAEPMGLERDYRSVDGFRKGASSAFATRYST